MAEENKYFQLQIITPDRIFYEGEASMVEFNSVDGELGVYKHHIPLTTVLAPGIVTITEPGGKKEAAVHAGFVQILGEKVTPLLAARIEKGIRADSWREGNFSCRNCGMAG